VGEDELIGLGGLTLIRNGDWAGFHAAVAAVIRRFSDEPRATDDILRRQALAIRERYSDEEYCQSVTTAWRLSLEAFEKRSPEQSKP
jgi:hypothetical protein